MVAHAVVYARGEDRAAGLGNAAGDGLFRNSRNNLAVVLVRFSCRPAVREHPYSVSGAGRMDEAERREGNEMRGKCINAAC